ncbi:autotransporter outer membrane beta-barrel domain-containing protein, partial [Fusobacterium sp. THCT1E2]
MIEKLMKAVKRGNKKRGRNIAIGAVVGFLLSCTAVMGADDNYLVIREKNGEIEFSTNNTNWSTNNPYAENNWNAAEKIYINNITLFGENAGKNGIVVEDYDGMNGIINTGKINASSYGIKAFTKNLINTGEINVVGDSAIGVYLLNNVDKMINTGKITVAGDNAIGVKNIVLLDNFINLGEINNLGQNGDISGFYTGEGVIKFINIGKISSIGGERSIGINFEGVSILNIGEIVGSGSAMKNFGIMNASSYLVNRGKISAVNKSSNNINAGIAGVGIIVVNSGRVSAEKNSNESYGINENGNRKHTVENTGIVYGGSNAIHTKKGIVKNYGILATDGSEVIDLANSKSNYGMYITEADGKITIDSNMQNAGLLDVIAEIKIEGTTMIDLKITQIMKKMTVKNAELNGESGIATSTKSFMFSGISGEYDNSILNGKDETLKVSGKGNEIIGSIINAYGTAVVMNEDMSTLTLDNTIVNGGISGDNTVKISGDGNTLVIQGDSVINGEDTVITVTGNNNAVTLEGNAIVNGKMESTGNNTLNLYGKVNDNSNELNSIQGFADMNILNDISGFVNMNIENNVTLFEDIKVTGTETVTIDKNGVLSLRLKKQDITTYSTIPTAVHAFSERDGKHDMVIKGTSQEDAGTLNFITNGIGREIYVDMENIKLENMKIKANSIIDSAEIHDDYIHLGAGSDLSGIVNPRVSKYDSLNKIY